MIELESIDAIVEQYRKFGWELRRILLSQTFDETIRTAIIQKYEGCETHDASLNALWFSRKNRNAETWELRRLEGLPFALVQVIDPAIPDKERDDLLRSVELQMAETQPKSVSENQNGK
jgi:hypothetical protein